MGGPHALRPSSSSKRSLSSMPMLMESIVVVPEGSDSLDSGEYLREKN